MYQVWKVILPYGLQLSFIVSLFYALLYMSNKPSQLVINELGNFIPIYNTYDKQCKYT